ncbi:uncharacterized protein LOC106713125 [Papilio machaon]|uniref:uncharacterized protein LOC106713125 n=1 Tax=Papilio machaon TaxID=76193 RepID=UPI001E665F64|nr:uncharacterized protein LOC106713125 [Papilio machaon]
MFLGNCHFMIYHYFPDTTMVTCDRHYALLLVVGAGRAVRALGALWALTVLAMVAEGAALGSLTAVFDVFSEDVIEKQKAMNRGFSDSDGVIELLREESRYPWEGTRRSLARPAVEVGPGAFKSDPVSLSPQALKKQLEHLIQLQQKLNNKNKNLNPYTSFYKAGHASAVPLVYRMSTGVGGRFGVPAASLLPSFIKRHHV